MKELFSIDLNDYEHNYIVYKRPSARGIILSGDKIALVYSKKEKYYKFPGGGIKENEDMHTALIREVREEVGIENFHVEDPFLKIITYDSHYFNTGSVVLNTIYYYRVTTDEQPDEEKTNYDLIEASTPFKLYFVDLDKLDSFLESEINNFDKPIYREMKIASKIYDEEYNKDDVI